MKEYYDVAITIRVLLLRECGFSLKAQPCLIIQYASGTQLDVKSYEVQLQQENKLEKLCTNTWLHQTEFLIDERGCNISVRAITRAGTSAPSHILIPPAERSGE